jgi:glycosyltransferase involved in cell wall biosynthesis
MTNPKIAVITPTIPTRNLLLKRAERSIDMQTMPAWETHVAIDYDRQGAAVTRQRALSMVTSQCDWIAPLDDDDEMMPFHLEALHEHAMQTGADYVYSWFEVVGPNGMSFGDYDPVFPPTHFTNPFDPNEPVETTITILIKRELLESVGGYEALHRPEEYAKGASTGEDRNLTLRCIEAGANIQHLVRRTWYWHHHGHNTSGRPDRW